MKLVTKLQVNDIIIEKSNDNNFDIITNKVKIKNKRAQSAINSKERLENQYSTSIDKGNAKKNFYNKHKLTKTSVKGAIFTQNQNGNYN